MEGKQRVLLNLPPGYHFAPTEDELIVHYLRRKLDGLPPHLPIFNDVTPITDYRPEQITDEFRDFGEGGRWYFFTKRTRKYATGSRPDRTTPGKGFWKATGPVREIPIRPGGKGKLVGRARTLVFYTGPDEPTHWTMYEYENENRTSEAEANDKNIDKLGEWVLCTIQKSQRCDVKKKAGGKAKGKAGGRKRKGKAQSGADQAQIQSAEVPETAWPEKGVETYVFDDLEQTGCPRKRPQMQQHEPPRSETMMVDDYDYNGIAYIWDDYMPPPPPLPLEYEVSPTVAGVGYSYNNMMYQPATSYLHAAHYAVEQDGYAGGHLGGLLGTGNIPCTYRPQHSCAAAGTTNLPWSTGATTSGQVEP